MIDSDSWLILDELASYLKLGRTKLYRMAQSGPIPACKVSAQWRFSRADIDVWMQEQRVNISSPENQAAEQ
ncbi:MAG: DNA-binding protein [Gammaproteobacteria bacterium]|nr:MAG: DNA-binding protein [Gammaproteobacteria bacterium]